MPNYSTAPLLSLHIGLCRSQALMGSDETEIMFCWSQGKLTPSQIGGIPSLPPSRSAVSRWADSKTGIATLSIFQGQNAAAWVSSRWVWAHQHCTERVIRGDVDRRAGLCEGRVSNYSPVVCREVQDKIDCLFRTSRNEHLGDLYKYFAAFSCSFKPLLMAFGILGHCQIRPLADGLLTFHWLFCEVFSLDPPSQPEKDMSTLAHLGLVDWQLCEVWQYNTLLRFSHGLREKAHAKLLKSFFSASFQVGNTLSLGLSTQSIRLILVTVLVNLEPKKHEITDNSTSCYNTMV